MQLSEYLKAEKGRMARLCEAIGAHAPDVSRWASGDRPVPIRHCVAIEQVTNGEVTRRDLRPLDWAEIWPDLVVRARRNKAAA